MPDPFTVLQVGFGTLGKKIAQELIARNNLHLISVVDINPEFQDKTVEEVLELDSQTNTRISQDLSETLTQMNENPADVALVVTSSHLEQVAPTISACINADMDVLSLCEELSYPFRRHPKLSQELDDLAKKKNKNFYRRFCI